VSSAASSGNAASLIPSPVFDTSDPMNNALKPDPSESSDEGTWAT
jgi:hypothetical protein